MQKDWSVFCHDCGKLTHMYDLFKHRPYDEAVMKRVKCFFCYSPEVVVTHIRDGVVLRDGKQVLGVLDL